MAASVGVKPRTSATRSTRERSISWPIPEMIGIVDSETARTKISSLNDQRSSRLPPPRTIAMTSSAGWIFSAFTNSEANSSAAPAPWTRDGKNTTSAIGQRFTRVVRKSAMAAPDALVMSPIRRGNCGKLRFLEGENRPSSSSRKCNSRSFASSVPIPKA